MINGSASRTARSSLMKRSRSRISVDDLAPGLAAACTPSAPPPSFSAVPGSLRKPALLRSSSAWICEDVVGGEQATVAHLLEAHAQGLRGSAAPPWRRGWRTASGSTSSLNSSSWVVTMFSISELSLASCRPRVLIRMPWLGIDAAMPFSSASARLLLASRLRMAGVVKARRVQLVKWKQRGERGHGRSLRRFDVYRKCDFLCMSVLMCIEISISLMATGLEAAAGGTLSWRATAHTTTERTHLGFQELVIAVRAHRTGIRS